jgi:choline dehydrogenase-like flavoprotein
MTKARVFGCGLSGDGCQRRSGVLDLNCEVFGVKGLYAAGSSTFPTSGYANPTLTIVTMSMQLASHLKSELRG